MLFLFDNSHEQSRIRVASQPFNIRWGRHRFQPGQFFEPQVFALDYGKGVKKIRAGLASLAQ